MLDDFTLIEVKSSSEEIYGTIKLRPLAVYVVVFSAAIIVVVMLRDATSSTHTIIRASF